MFHILLVLFLVKFFPLIPGVTFSNTHDYDAYGKRIASTNYFVVRAQNDGFRYVISMAPFGTQYFCTYNYNSSNDFIITIATSRRQNASQLSFVYLSTNSTDGYYQKLGLFTFFRTSTNSSCNPFLHLNEGEHQVKLWNRPPSELSTLQVDLHGKYAYGFLSNAIFIYSIDNSTVHDLLWKDIFSSIIIDPHALDIGETSDGISMAIVAGYYQIDIQKTLPAIYLIRLNPPYNMTLVDNYTFVSDYQKFVRSRYTSSYDFDYAMSVSMHDSTQQVLVGVPQLSKTYRFTFNSTKLILVNTFDQAARSTTWLDSDGTMAGLLLSDVATLPWAQSRVHMMNTTSGDVMYAYPNNQQILEQWSRIPPTFIQLTRTSNYQLVVLTSDGVVVLVPSTPAGYFTTTNNINVERRSPEICRPGTYKNSEDAMPCTICPAGTRSISTNIVWNSSNRSMVTYATIYCSACLSDSFCPLASISDLNQSTIQSISEAYAYPISGGSTSIDDVLMTNTFNLQINPHRCLLISPFFWALIALLLAFIILVIMGVLYYSPTGKKHFQRLEYIFRHFDLIGNGELWFGGLVSFSMLVLIIYGFWFGAVFASKYPIETSSDIEMACDTSTRNAQLSSSLQLLATIKTADENLIFQMLDVQEFTLTMNFLQTSFTCDDVTAQETVGFYFLTIPHATCTMHPDNATLTVRYRVPYHQMIMHINLTGPYYIGGLHICLTAPSSTGNDSSYVVRDLKYCELFSSSNQTLGQETEIYFALTKVINRTESLDYSGSMNYSAIWIPTSTHGPLDDHLAYEQQGAFLRYLSTQHTVIITFSETQFYVMNKQEPIARVGEVLFHNVLFTTTVIGIFALVFVVFKLTFMPIVKWIIKHELVIIQCLKLHQMMQSRKKNKF